MDRDLPRRCSNQIHTQSICQSRQVNQHVGQFEFDLAELLSAERFTLRFSQPLEMFEHLTGLYRHRCGKILRRMKLLPVACVGEVAYLGG
jgi:hypothetical protein